MPTNKKSPPGRARALSLSATACFVFAGPPASAQQMHHEGHPTVFHAFLLETGIGAGPDGRADNLDFDGWIGTDYDKLWLRAEVERTNNRTEQAEAWAMYSRNIAMFWDAQIGLRYDSKPRSTAYLTAGFKGLARYFFETGAHVFLSNDGELTARLRQENDLLITQRLIAKPYLELNLSAQKTRDRELGRGFTHGEIGLLTRYEISRKFAPYIDLRYERALGGTAALVEKSGERNGGFVAALGLRLLF